jgi:hypothetical protein
VTEEVGGHLRAATAATARYDGPDGATVVASWTEPGIAALNVGHHFEISPRTALARVN